MSRITNDVPERPFESDDRADRRHRAAIKANQTRKVQALEQQCAAQGEVVERLRRRLVRTFGQWIASSDKLKRLRRRLAVQRALPLEFGDKP